MNERYEKLEKLRYLVKQHSLLLQEEARSVAVALFGCASLIVHLGLDQSDLIPPDWYKQSRHSYLKSVIQLLDKLAAWPDIDQLEFLLSSGGDPFTTLQVRLDRQIFRLDPDSSSDTVKPSDLQDSLETQRIYVFSNHPPTD